MTDAELTEFICIGIHNNYIAFVDHYISLYKNNLCAYKLFYTACNAKLLYMVRLLQNHGIDESKFIIDMAEAMDDTELIKFMESIK